MNSDVTIANKNWISAIMPHPLAVAEFVTLREKLLKIGARMDFGDGVTQFEHQPIGGGVQNEAYLIGERRPTGCDA